MVNPIPSFDYELYLKMDTGLDYANSQKDPNFFQCQLIVCILFDCSPLNLVTMNPMLQRLLTFPSQSELLILILAADLNFLTKSPQLPLSMDIASLVA